MDPRMVLITMTGPDRPDIIAAVTTQIADAGACIRDIVRELADTHINQQSLDSILFLLGLSEREMAEIGA
jgi:predicted amino acid-binding ACT domain protein